jgi:hypothetical protein
VTIALRRLDSGHRPPLPDKIINQIATMVATRTRDNSFPMFETAPQISYSNKGKIFILNAGCIVPIATIRFDFQDDVYTLAINWRGSDIPSQAPRKDYFDFHQSYDKHSAFWSVLQKLLTTDKA